MAKRLLAYHITLRTYGTWLRGDPRGWASRSCDASRSRRPPHPGLEKHDRARMRHPAFRMTDAQCALVRDAIVEKCAFRGWRLLGVGVEPVHGHVVVVADTAPEHILNELKGWATQRLREQSPDLTDRPIWVRSGHIRRLWSPAAVARAIDYARRHAQPPFRPDTKSRDA